MRSRKLLEFFLINSTFTFEWTKLFIWRVLGKTSKVNLLKTNLKRSQGSGFPIGFPIDSSILIWLLSNFLMMKAARTKVQVRLNHNFERQLASKWSNPKSQLPAELITCTKNSPWPIWCPASKIGEFWAFLGISSSMWIAKFRRKGGGPPNSRKFTKWFSKCTCFESLIRKWENPK